MKVVYIIIIIIIIFFVYKQNNQVEHYWDLAPYELSWDTFKCLDSNCARKVSYDCYNWCNNIGEPGAQANCQMRCSDYADQQFTSLKLNNRTFNSLLPRFEHVALWNDKHGDIVEWNSYLEPKYKIWPPYNWYDVRKKKWYDKYKYKDPID